VLWALFAVAVIVVLLPAGVAWIAVVAGMNAATQAFLPGWVRARALSIYQLVLFTTFAASAVTWGALADLTAREPVTYWPSPEITLTPDVADTPVLVTVRGAGDRPAAPRSPGRPMWSPSLRRQDPARSSAR
jgi:transmembrane secretion effector